MKKFGVSNYQIQNVKQNWSNLMINTKKLINERTDEIKEQITASVGENLEEFMVKANESLVSLNRWLATREKELKASIKKDEDSESVEASSSEYASSDEASETEEKPAEKIQTDKPIH